MQITYTIIFGVLAILCSSSFIEADDLPKAEPAAPQNGVFINQEVALGGAAAANFKVMLELKDGRFRYWVLHNLVPINGPKLPFSGEYSVEGDTVVLKNKEIPGNEPVRFKFALLNRALILLPQWSASEIPEADYRKRLTEQEVMRQTKKSPETVWKTGDSEAAKKRQ
jgi:hypothetical protein